MSHALSFPCPHCGTSYSLTAEYLSQYGGKNTACQGCGNRFRLPVPDPAAVAEAGAVDAVGIAPDPSGAGDESPPAVSYAGPVWPPLPSEGIWRENEEVAITTLSPKLPSCCVKCAEPMDGKKVWLRLKWSPRMYTGHAHVTRFARWMNEREMLFKIGYCRRHRAKARAARRALWGVFVIAALSFCVGLATPTGGRGSPDLSLAKAIMILAAIVLFVAGLIWASVAGKPLRVLDMDDHSARVAGFGQPFLDRLPSFRAAQEAAAAQAAGRMHEAVG